MNYSGHNFSHLLGLPGFGDESIKNHFQIYADHVRHFNGRIDVLNGTRREDPRYGEIKEKFSWDFNGIKLHEAYFGNMGKQSAPLEPQSGLADQIISTYGSIQSWEDDFWEVSGTRGEGWAILAWDPRGKSLVNLWMPGHGVGTPFHCVSLLVNDCFDHAYMNDYGDDRSDYTEAFLKVVDWPEVKRRYDSVLELTRAAEFAL